MIALLAAFLAGAAVAWVLGRSTSAAPVRAAAPAAGPMLTDAVLEWLRRTLAARAVWAVTPAVDGEPAGWLVAAAPGLPPLEEHTALEHRVRESARHGRDLVERFEAGTLVVRARAGAAAAALLHDGTGGTVVDEALRELDGLLRAVERQPRLASVARAEANPGSLESLEAASRRLAFDLEGLVPGEVLVVVSLVGGPTVVALGGAADMRLEGAVASRESPLGHFMTSTDAEKLTVASPLGPHLRDRRTRERVSLLLPIEEAGKRIGAVVLRPTSGRVPTEMVGTAGVLVARAAPRISRAREAHELRTAAERDKLTGLGNRRRLELAMHDIAVTEGALILLDVDHFKKLNDTLGHPAGDAALVHVATVLRREVRAGDVVARVGGEEFAVWLPGTPLEAALRLAERLRHGLEKSDWAWKGSRWPLQASFGVAHWGETTRHVDNLMAQADAALYAAKQAGRNRVAQASG